MLESGLLAELRDPLCTKCRLSEGISEGSTCLISQGSPNSEILVVTKYPLTLRSQKEMDQYLDEAGITSSRAYTGAVKCRSEKEPGKQEIQTCSTSYLEEEIRAISPKAILAIGNEALLALTGKVGIMKHRGRVVGERENTPVFSTISPAMIRRNPGQRAGFLSDLSHFSRLLRGQKAPTAPPKRIRMVTTPEGLKALGRALRTAEGAVYDIETNGFDEFRPTSIIASLALTVWDREGNAECWAVGLGHPESPWRGKWRRVLQVLQSSLCRSGLRVVAHNGKFDGRWMHQFGVPIQLTFDTMLAAHLLDENRPKGLKPLAQSLLGVEPWDIDASRVMEQPLRRVLKYNGLDTWYTYHLYLLFKQQLAEQPRLGKIMAKLLVPASNILTEVERGGIWMDRERLASRSKQTRDILENIDQQLRAHVPPISEWPEKLKGREVNFNPSDFCRWWLFDHLGYPVLARGKSGAPSMAEGILLSLKAIHPDDEVLELLIGRTKWNKYSGSFFSAYEELIDDTDHIHTTFKLTGTVTGRLSSGKAESDKVSGRIPNRGVNLQQVPRDNFVRGLFGAPPGWLFVECDYSQVELRIAAFLAREKTMMHLYRIGADIHTDTARDIVGHHEVTSAERKKAKAVNFGFLYGMSAKTFITTAWNNYGIVVGEDESMAFRRVFFQKFSDLPSWHNRQRLLVRKYKRVESPLGRIRHLPDIDSSNPEISGEAARQAINSPVQSFASDMCLLALVLLYREFKRRGLKSRSVGTVHDALNLVVPEEEVSVVVPLVREVMENLPLERMFGVHLDVPIIADVKLGRYWGDALELPSEISANSAKVLQFIHEHQEELGI